MTVTVRVMARALGAVVETNGETIELAPHQDRDFHIEESQDFSVRQPTHGQVAETDRARQLMHEEVPGRRQNDELVAPVSTEQPGTSEASAPESTPSRGSRRGGGADV